MTYIENWLALGACIYSRKTADAALAALGLRKEIKRKPVYPEIEANALVAKLKIKLSMNIKGELINECKGRHWKW